MESTQESRLSGLALSIGALMVAVGSFFLPRGTGSRTDYIPLIEVRAENAGLTHTTSMLTAFGILLWVAGLVALWRTAAKSHGTSDALLGSGIAILLISAVLYLALTGLQHMIVHFLNHGIGAGAGAGQTEGLTNMAVTLQGARAGLFMVKELCEMIGFLLLGLAVWRRAPARLAKIAAIIVVYASCAELVALQVIEHAHDLTDAMLPVLTVGGAITLIWQVWIGAGLWRGSHRMLAR